MILFSKWNIQRFEGENEKTGGVVTQNPPETDKPKVETVHYYDQIAKKDLQITPEINEALKNAIGATRAEATARHSKQMKEMETKIQKLTEGDESQPTRSQLLDIIEELKDKDLPKEVRERKTAQKERDKAAADHKSAVEGMHSYKRRLEDRIINQSIIDSLGQDPNKNVFNLKKTVRNIRADSKMQIEWLKDDRGIETDDYRIHAEIMLPDSSGAELTMQETTLTEGIEKWLARSDNANELKSNLQSGSGTTSSGGRTSPTGEIIFKRGEVSGIGASKRKALLETIEAGKAYKIIDD